MLRRRPKLLLPTPIDCSSRPTIQAVGTRAKALPAREQGLFSMNANLLNKAATHAARYLETVDARPIAATASFEQLRRQLGKKFPEAPMAAEQVIDDLVRDAEGGLLGSSNARFFGWVIGGTLPVALAADWLTSAWDQNAASNLTAPAEAIVEEVCGDWAKQLLGLPAAASFGLVTGCQMAHTTAFAAARHKLLRDCGWNVEEQGLAGAPALRVLTTGNRHESIIRAVCLLGIGANAIGIVPGDNLGRMDMGALEEVFRNSADAPTIVSLQAGDLNTGLFDRFGEACRIAHAHGAWVHVDGAFGLWAATSEKYRHLLDGVAEADSWATDGHKWLNLPFDCGLVFVADPAPHRAAFAQDTSYSVPVQAVRNQKDWNPEWSRRGRGFSVYAAIRALGRSGIADIVERCCAHATRLAEGIGELAGAEMVARPIVNQGLVRFLSPDGDHDRRTDAVIRRIQAGGVAWFGGVTWRGMRVMRISVCNWATTGRDVEAAIGAVRAAMSATGG
jgi:glutamate/tyrosine decarboxylase-like PLP-dependent enzyme